MRKSGAEVLQLWQFGHLTWYRPGQVCCGRDRWLARQYKAEWRRTSRPVYLQAVCKCLRWHILVPVGLMPWDVVLEKCDNCSVERFYFANGLG